MFALPSIVVLLAASLAIPDANPTLYIFDKFCASNKRLHNIFSGKRIWITGASSGIGAELARQLHSHGAKIIISGRREEELRIAQTNCQKWSGTDKNDATINSTGDVSVLPFDITDSDERLSAVVSSALKVYGGLDVLILNAGAGQLSPAVDDSFTTTRALMEVNFMGPVRLAMEVIKQEGWKKETTPNSKGHIVVTSSVASKMALPLGTSYAASKHAVHGYFSSLRSECAEWLRIDLPCPGPIATSFQSNVLNEPIASSSTPSSEVDEDDNASEVQMPVDRCAKLIISGMLGPASLMQETWISRQPTLFFLFLNQYFPKLSNFILGKIGPLRLKAFRAGLPLYKISSWVQAAKMEKEMAKKSNADE